MRYDDALASLYQVPLDQFVAERKRLAGELKAAGDKEGAARLAKCARPPISAWVVDQLWWHARAAFGALFDTAQQLRDGKLDATTAHREALARLRAHAAKILGDADHGASEATLRRVTQTLSSLAAAGGWEPDVPGALSADRDPPGFEAVGVTSNVIAFPVRPAPSMPAPAPPRAPPVVVDPEDERRREREATAARAEVAAELRRAEAERARAAAERHRLEAALRTAQGDVEQREREVARLERELAAARHMVAQAKAVAAGLAERLAQLDN